MGGEAGLQAAPPHSLPWRVSWSSPLALSLGIPKLPAPETPNSEREEPSCPHFYPPNSQEAAFLSPFLRGQGPEAGTLGSCLLSPPHTLMGIIPGSCPELVSWELPNPPRDSFP